jgi:mono/diheme cytochrome c family protein
MRRRYAVTILASLVAVALLATESGAAEMNGPMSSAGNSTLPVTGAVPGDAAAAGQGAALDVQNLFANTCGWCHSDAGRVAGRGPKLMGTTLTDAEIIHRIKVGKPGAMPSFDGAFNSDEIQAIVKYIRALKEDGASK